MLHHLHCRTARDRIVEMEVMKLERRNARLRSEQAQRVNMMGPNGRPALRGTDATSR